LKKRALGDSNKEDVVTKTTKSEKTESPSHFSQNRFNPFDRDLHMEEDYFDFENVRPNSGKNVHLY
jgi:hypothetical protein